MVVMVLTGRAGCKNQHIVQDLASHQPPAAKSLHEQIHLLVCAALVPHVWLHVHAQLVQSPKC